MELTSNLIVAKTGKIRKELTVRNTMGTGFASKKLASRYQKRVLIIIQKSTMEDEKKENQKYIQILFHKS